MDSVSLLSTRRALASVLATTLALGLAGSALAGEGQDCNTNSVAAGIEPFVEGMITTGPVVPGEQIDYRVRLFVPPDVPPLIFPCDIEGGQLAVVFPDFNTYVPPDPNNPTLPFVRVAGYGPVTPANPVILPFGNDPLMPFEAFVPIPYIVEAEDFDGDGELNARVDYGQTGYLTNLGIMQENGVFQSTPPLNTATATASISIPGIVPVINVEKSADVEGLCEGTPTEVTYTYLVTNQTPAAIADNISFVNVQVVDDMCGPVTFVMGDANGDNELDVNETWVYQCTTTIDTETTNVVVVTANDNRAGREYSDDDDLTIPSEDPPVVTVDPPDAEVCEGTPVQFCAEVSGGTPPYTYLWTTVDGNIPGANDTECITVTEPGEYCVMVIDKLGCTHMACADLTTSPPLEVSVNDDEACAGDSGELCAEVLGGTPPFTYMWSNGETTECITVTVPGEYCVTVFDSEGCSGIACGTFTVYPEPTVTVPDAETCTDDDVELCATPSGGTPPYLFMWSNGETTQCITVSQPGEYCVTITDANGCMATDCGTVEIYPEPSADPPTVEVCEGEEGIICANPSGGTPPYTFEWTTGETTECITVTEDGEYCVTVTDSNGCMVFACGGLIVYPNPTVTVEDASFCPPGTAELCAVVEGGTPPFEYLWSNGQTTECITVDEPGEYCVVVTDANGCEAETCASVDQGDLPECVIDGPILVCPGEQEIFFNVTELTGVPDPQFMWSIEGDAEFCPGAAPPGLDIDGNGVIDAFDLSVVLDEWGPCPDGCQADFNNDGEVGPADLAQILQNWGTPGAAGADTICVNADDVCGGSFLLVVTVTADGCTNTCKLNVTVDDLTPPTIECPPNMVVQCDGDVPPADIGDVSAEDDCGDVVITWEGDEVSEETCPRIVLRTYRATDECGNIAECTQRITVIDTIDPEIECPDNITVECPRDVPAVDTSTVEVSDNCPGEIIVEHVGDVSSGTDCPEVITRTYRATDQCGNTATCVQIISINDTTPPEITCPQDLEVTCIEDVPSPNPDDVTASDNCEGDVIVEHVGDESEGDCPIIITRTYRATDQCGNASDCVQLITVNDTEPPTIECPADLEVECDSDVPDPNPDDVFADDNCGDVIVEHVSDTSEGNCPRTIFRTYRATDQCGNTTDCEQLITVNDTQPPTAECPADLEVQCPDDVPSPDPDSVDASDNCGSVIVEFVSDESDGETCPETIVRTYRATDECGNSTDCTQTITVNDTTPPTIECPEDITIPCEDSTDPSNTGTPTVGDNCDGPIEVDFMDEIFMEEEQFTIIKRTWTATDGCGNVSDCMQFITLDCPCEGRVGDFLWEDTNGNGCQDPGEPGISGIRVILNRQFDDGSTEFIADVVSDTGGFYIFEDLRLCAGNYQICIDESTVPDNYSETLPNQNCDGGDESDSDCVDGKVKFTLDADNSERFDIDCGFIPGICDLSVDVEGCVVGPPPGAGDICDGDKIAQLRMIYTGEDCSATISSQDDDKFGCSGDPAFEPMVRIVATGKDGSPTWFDGEVMLDGEYVIDAGAAGEDKLESETQVTIYDLNGGVLQEVFFHTSCSQPIALGDQYGANRIVGATFDNGEVVELPGKGECVTEITPSGGDACDGKVETLTLIYTGEDCSASNTSQDNDKWNCDGDPNFEPTVRIVAVGKDGDPTWFDGIVNLDESFVVAAADGGEDDLDSETHIFIYDLNDNLLQEIEFHTSCSQPLGPGDQFGSIFVFGMQTTDGGNVSLGSEVEYTYTVCNEGDLTVTNISVIDDTYGEIPGSPIASLEPGECVTLTLTVLVFDEVTNTVTVSTTDFENCEADDSTTITVAEPPHDCCENGRPRGLVMVYTGEDCSATSHSQDDDKVECDGDPMFEASVRIVATGKNGDDVWFDGVVDLNQEFVIDAANGGEDDLDSETHVQVYDLDGNLLQDIEFHTSCSQPLFTGNQFGSLLLVGCEPPGGPGGNDACEFGRPRVLSMQYTGEDCNATNHAQDRDKVECAGDPAFADPVYIVATGKNASDILFEGEVALGALFDIDAANAGENRLDSETHVMIYDLNGNLLQDIEFHTSCSQPLRLGDQFGSVIVQGSIGENEAVHGFLCHDGSRPVSLTVTYTGQSCDFSEHAQAEEMVYCDGDPQMAMVVQVKASNRPNPDQPGAIIWYDELVIINQSFEVRAAAAGAFHLDDDTWVHVYDLHGNLIQLMKFHTSCSQPLNVGDQYGSLLLNTVDTN